MQYALFAARAALGAVAASVTVLLVVGHATPVAYGDRPCTTHTITFRDCAVDPTGVDHR